MKVLFCGTGHFQDGYIFTKEQLSLLDDDIIVEECDREQLDIAIIDADVVIPLMSKITSELIIKATKLKLIMQYGAGIEGVDIDAASSKGIYVCKIPSDTSCNALSCAEHAIFLALAVYRRYKELITSMRQGHLGYPSGRTLYHSTVAIIGFGGIGKQLVKRLKGFDVKIYLIVRNPATSYYDTIYKDEYKDVVISAVTMEEWSMIGPVVDILFLCCQLTSDNIKMINKSFLSYIKHDAILINIARGGLLDYDDVYASLQSGHIGGLGLDVFHTEPFPIDDMILNHPKVIATPHVAGVTIQSYHDMAVIVAENVMRIRDGISPTGVMNQDDIMRRNLESS